MLILASLITFLKLSLESFLFFSFHLYLLFLMLQAHLAILGLDKSRIVWVWPLLLPNFFAAIALISLLITPHFLFKSSISFKCPNLLNTIPRCLYISVSWTIPSFTHSSIAFSGSCLVLIAIYLVFFNPYIIFFSISILLQICVPFLMISAVPTAAISCIKTDMSISTLPYWYFTTLLEVEYVAFALLCLNYWSEYKKTGNADLI